MAQSVRITVTLRPALLERLKQYARDKNIPMFQVVEMAVSQFIEPHEQERLDRMYAGLFELVGMSNAPITDASNNIDEILYGENGVWRGDHD